MNNPQDIPKVQVTEPEDFKKGNLNPHVKHVGSVDIGKVTLNALNVRRHKEEGPW